MNQFYLNNIVGAPSSLEEGVTALRNAALAFGELASDKALNVSERVVMDDDPEVTCFGDFFLKHLVEEIPDREDRKSAYIMLRAAYPMEDHLPWNEKAEPIIEGEYKYDDKDATNLAVAKSNGAMILSFAFSDAFEKNTLTLTSAAEPSDDYPQEIEVENLYGSEENMIFIKEVLQAREGVSVNLFDEIRKLENTIISPSVEKAFGRLTLAQQESIVVGFQEAIRQKLLFPNIKDSNLVINPNDELVRYEPYSKKEKIFELAIYYPLAVRVYLAQNNGKLYLLDISSKKASKDGNNQNAEIRSAEKVFVAMKQSS